LYEERYHFILKNYKFWKLIMAGATKEIVKKALYNDANAQYEMGRWFYENEIIESAYFWIKQAAQQGHSDAILLLEKLNARKK
jgi:TPR repeat protein